MNRWRRRDPADIKIEDRLGEGLTSQVYKAIRKHSDFGVEQTVAVKIFKSRKTVQALKNEIHILSRVESLHCVRLLGWADFKKGPALILEYLEGVSLSDLVAYEKLPENMVSEILAQLQAGIRDLHAHNIVHGDLSGKNIFITTKGVVKILDFGFSAINSGLLSHGTPQFLALEAWRGGALTQKSDLFSAGLLYHDLLAGDLHQNRSRAAFKTRAALLAGRNALLAENPAHRTFLPLSSCAAEKDQLAAAVQRVVYKKKATSLTTRWMGEIAAPRRLPRLAPALLVTILLFFHQLQPASQPIKSNYYSLDVRSHMWSQIRLLPKGGFSSAENIPPIYAPYKFRRIPAGTYELHWVSEGKSGIILVQLDKSRRILIK